MAAVTTSCFLSFLLPHCNFTTFLRGYFQPEIQPFDERLASALEVYNDSSVKLYSHPGPRNKSLMGEWDDLITSVPFYRFVQSGLGSFVATGRAFESSEKKLNKDVSLLAGTDLLRLLAMAISPDPCRSTSTGYDGSQEEANSIAYSTFPYAFHLVYTDRVTLIKLCAESLVIPENSGEDATSDDATVLSFMNDTTKMLASSIHELRSSLFDFASYNAQSEKDACIAYKALVNILVREGNSSTIRAEFKRLVDILLTSRSREVVTSLSETLSDLIEQYNGSRYYADGSFTRESLVLLAKCIHDRVVTNEEQSAAHQEQEPVESKSRIERQKIEWDSFRVIALLKVTTSIFYFILDIGVMRKMAGESLSQEVLDGSKIEVDTKFQLLRDVSVLLLCPLNTLVFEAASKLLSLALAFDESYLSEMSNVKHIFICTKKCIEGIVTNTESGKMPAINSLKGVIYTVSRRSETYAFNLLSYCSNQVMLGGVVYIISSAQPQLTSRVVDQSSMNFTDMGALDRVLTQLSNTMTYNSEQLKYMSVEELLKNDSMGDWTLYQIVRHCFVTGNFCIAHQVLVKHLVQKSIQQSSFLWFGGLIRLAEAEGMLRSEGYSALPRSLSLIGVCHSIISSLAALEGVKSREYPFGSIRPFEFQVRLLTARAEFLQLIKNTRCTCIEYMLTSNSGSDNTRTTLHLRNLPKCFTMLASHYMQLYRIFGLHYCQQSRSALRGLISMCSFFGEMFDLVFDGNKMQIDQEQAVHATIPSCDKNHPMGILLSRLRLGARKAKDSSRPIEPKVLLDAVDVILQCPVPFPSSFFVVKPVPMIHSIVNGHEMIGVYPGVPFQLLLAGIVPDEFVSSAKTSFHQIVAWSSVRFVGRFIEDDDDANDNKSNTGDDLIKSIRQRSKTDAVTNILPGGKFVLRIELEPIIEEGYHRVDIQLGCRDVCCGEWFMPTQDEIKTIVRVSE
jgi:hypothetical protein